MWGCLFFLGSTAWNFGNMKQIVFCWGSGMLMAHVDNDNLAFQDGKRQHPVCASCCCKALLDICQEKARLGSWKWWLDTRNSRDCQCSQIAAIVCFEGSFRTGAAQASGSNSFKFQLPVCAIHIKWKCHWNITHTYTLCIYIYIYI